MINNFMTIYYINVDTIDVDTIDCLYNQLSISIDTIDCLYNHYFCLTMSCIELPPMFEMNIIENNNGAII